MALAVTRVMGAPPGEASLSRKAEAGNARGRASTQSRGLGRLLFWSLLRVHQVAKLFGWLEIRNSLGRDFHPLAGLGVAANAGIALADAERAETANLDLVALVQCPDHRLKNCLHNDFAITARQVAKAGYLFHQVCLRHNPFWPPLTSITGFDAMRLEKEGESENCSFASASWGKSISLAAWWPAARRQGVMMARVFPAMPARLASQRTRCAAGIEGRSHGGKPDLQHRHPGL